MTATAAHPSDLDTVPSFISPSGRREVAAVRTAPRPEAARHLSDEQVEALGRLACASGADGIVCSPHEVANMRVALGPDALLVTPGVRPAGADVGDQKRVATPAQAVRNGSTHLVVGRPILEAADPCAAARAIAAEMAGA